MHPNCCVCELPATVQDTEYNEFYCNDCGILYEVFKGPHEILEEIS